VRDHEQEAQKGKSGKPARKGRTGGRLMGICFLNNRAMILEGPGVRTQSIAMTKKNRVASKGEKSRQFSGQKTNTIGVFSNRGL